MTQGHHSPSLPSTHVPKPKKSRVKIGLLMGAVVLFATFYGSWAWVAFVASGCIFGFLELNQMMLAKGFKPSKIITITAGTLLFTLAVLHQTQHFSSAIAAMAIASFIRLLFRKPVATIGDIGATLMGIFYTIYLPIHFILLRDIGVGSTPNPLQQPGLWYVLFTLVVIASSDIAAYYFGKAFGKHLLYPEISPKKTQEGSVGGSLAGILVGMLLGYAIGLGWPHALILSFLLVVVGQLGDLSESLIKRDAGQKDSGAIFEGHGGLLDRMDSYIFSGAVSFYYIHWVVLQQGLAADLLHWVQNWG